MISGKRYISNRLAQHQVSFFSSPGRLVDFEYSFIPDKSRGKFLWQEYNSYLRNYCLPVLYGFDKELHVETLNLLKGFRKLSSYQKFIPEANMKNMSFAGEFADSLQKWSYKKELALQKPDETSNEIDYCLKLLELGISQFNFQVCQNADKPNHDYFIVQQDEVLKKSFYREPGNDKEISSSVSLLRNIE